MKYYAGIGSRNAPPEILSVMTQIAEHLELRGYVLRSGAAKGSDTAFEAGVKNPANKEIFVGRAGSSVEAKTIAESIHPAWYNLSDYARGYHGRNVYQVLGKDLKTHVSFVVCWTLEGKEIGGTRTAIVLAKRLGIPVYNLAVCSISSVEEFVEDVIKNT